jgi:hypothetical protein
MTLIAQWAITLAGRRAASRFKAGTRAVAETQQRRLRSILQANAGTEYGREFGFGAVRSLQDYARVVPVVTYDDLSERIARMRRGERNVLTAEDPVMFARTSGTTGEPKYIPVTPKSRAADHVDPMRTWLYHAQQDHPGIFRGEVISLVSPAVEGHTESGIPYGSASGALYRSAPRIAQKTYLVPYPVFEIEDYDAKYYVLMRLGLVGHVTLLCTANPSSIVKLCEFTEEHAEDLIRDVRDGTVKAGLALSPEARAVVESKCRPQPDLARSLDAMRSRRGGRLLPADFWPDLKLIGCWKGGTVGSYLERFPERFDPDGRGLGPVRDLGYVASEMRGSIPVTDDGSSGVLTVHTNVYEFVETDQVDADPDDASRWDFLGAHELEAPREYYVFVTTEGGLYRYDINDIVRVEDFHNEAPIVSFQRKGRGMTSITGEKVSVNQIIEAVTAAAAETGVTIAHFRALADVRAARYVFEVEPTGPLAEAQGRQLLQGIETRLAGLNLEYEGKRKSQRLGAPALHVMRSGWYDRGKGRQGQRVFQSKTIVLKPQEEEADRSIRSEELCIARISLDPQAEEEHAAPARDAQPAGSE